MQAVDSMAESRIDDLEPGPEVKVITQSDTTLLVAKPRPEALSDSSIISDQGTIRNIHVGDLGADVESVNVQVLCIVV